MPKRFQVHLKRQAFRRTKPWSSAQSTEIKENLRANTEEAMALGIFGAPSFTTPSGELFWGDDRLEQALEWSGR